MVEPILPELHLQLPRRMKLFVPGVPVPQGSMSVFNGRVVHQKSKALKDWRSLIAAAYIGDQNLGPIQVELLFVMPRPRSVTREYPCVKPDLDKLCRSVLDALTGMAYKDDSQVVSLVARKVYGPLTGVEITVGVLGA
jgi:crossover junction endodeoxyribonuclease RusA